MKSHKIKPTAKELLHYHQLKMTPSRLAVLGVFAKTKEPITIDHVFKEVGSSDRSTVHRNIVSFFEKGILHKVDLRTDVVLYELADHHHHHIVCEGCGTVEDFEICDVDTLSKKILVKSTKFKKVINHSFELFGVCNQCFKNNVRI